MHSITSCRHPVLSGMVTFRHDKAVHMIVDALLKAHHETPFQLLLSAGRRFQESTAPLTKTIPDWALPGYSLQPDLVLILGWDPSTPPPPQPTAAVTFIIADLAIGHGRTSSARIQRKQAKYAALVGALRQRGWSARGAAPGTCDPEVPIPTRPAQQPDDNNPADEQPDENEATPPPPPLHTDIFVVSLGATGELYTSTVRTLTALGLNKPAISTLLAALHRHLISSAHKILSTRRKLDTQLHRQPTQPASARRGEG